MKRILIAVLTAAATLMFGGGAWADSAHFVKFSASIGDPHLIGDPDLIGNPDLFVSFKEAGLGANAIIIYGVTADATATYVCVNSGGANPSAANKTTVAVAVSASARFTSTKNGTVTGTIEILPPGPGDFTCSPGQSLELAFVSYSNINLTDRTNDISIGNPNISECLLADVRGAC